MTFAPTFCNGPCQGPFFFWKTSLLSDFEVFRNGENISPVIFETRPQNQCRKLRYFLKRRYAVCAMMLGEDAETED